MKSNEHVIGNTNTYDQNPNILSDDNNNILINRIVSNTEKSLPPSGHENLRQERIGI